jgi:hypothetical protein
VQWRFYKNITEPWKKPEITAKVLNIYTREGERRQRYEN